MSQYNQGLVYDWGQISSPFQNQQHLQMGNSFPYSYTTNQLSSPNSLNVSPFQTNNRNYLDSHSSFLNYPQCNNTPSYDRSFASSGYASGNSSFASPNNYIRSYPTYGYPSNLANNSFNESFGNGVYQQNTQQTLVNDSILNDQLQARKRNTKRQRVGCNNDENVNNILNQVFQSTESNNELSAPKAKRVYRKKTKLDGNESNIPVLSETTDYNNVPTYDYQHSIKNLINENLVQQETGIVDENNDELFDEFDDDHDITQSSTGDKKKRVLTKSQRVAANQRERKRMGIMNESFVELRQKLPISTGRKRRKMSRLDVVVGAMEYINYLDQLLSSTDGPVQINFQEYQNRLFMIDC